MKKVVLNLICAMLFCNLKSFSQNCELICNGDFESPSVISSPHLVSNSAMSCWQTTATDSILELWYSGFQGVVSYSGNQFLEINANEMASVYQEVYFSAGDFLTISFAHRARVGVDTMSVSLGTQNNLPVVLGYFADSTSSWGYYVINYTVPASGYYRVSFNSVYSGGNLASLGNFIDDVSVCASAVGFKEVNQAGLLLVKQNHIKGSVTIHVKANQNGFLMLYDALGKQVYSIPIDESNMIIETNPLHYGVYIAQFVSNKNVITKKFLVD
jgi:hypothetical protein